MMHGEMILARTPPTLGVVEIHFVTGKGGVGKSAVAAGLALQLASGGKKTLLVELGDESFYQDYLGLPEVDYTPRSYRQKFDVSLWSGASCLRDYALYLLKLESLYKLFFENPVSRTLVDVAPALSELAILGKVTSGPPRNVGPRLPYEALVVDAFATGHFLALLKAPVGMGEAVRFGPMGEQSRGILKVLRNPDICRYHLVCLPEELPVQESLELDDGIREVVGASSFLWLNKWVDYPSDLDPQGPAFERDFHRKNQRQKEAWKEISKRFNGRVQKLPFFFETDEGILVEKIAKDMTP